jgi:adenosylmethionine-8-amino-7-oxononanoate aminotransferase
LIKAAITQMRSLDYAHTSFFSNAPQEVLAKRLIEASNGDFSKALFLSGGSEAMEAALKLARQYFVERGEPHRRHFIARHQSYHGNTLGALSIGHNVGRRVDYAPMLFDVSRIGSCSFYRHGGAGESADVYAERAAVELEAEIMRLPPKSVIGFVAEPIVGATSGALVPPPGYFRRIEAICRKHGVLLILDEVMCGMGRTGRLFAYEWEGIRPDIIAVGKSLGSGVQPISAVLASADVVSAIAAGSGRLKTGHTYMGHPIGCAVALAAVDIIAEPSFLADVRAKGEMFSTHLRRAFKGHVFVGDIRGRGLLWAVEFVQNRAHKLPFPAALELNERVKTVAMEHGLLVYPGGGTADGASGDHILLAPPATCTEAELIKIARLARVALDKALSDAGFASSGALQLMENGV